MPRRLQRPNRLKRPRISPQTGDTKTATYRDVGKAKKGKPISVISADVDHSSTQSESTASQPQPSTSTSNPGSLRDESSPGSSRENPQISKFRGRRKGNKNDDDGAMTDRLMETIRSGDQYPQRVTIAKTSSKKVHFTSTASKSKKGKDKNRGSSIEEFDWNKPGVQESLEICQGLSKIKLDDWFPFYDFQHLKRMESKISFDKATFEEESINESDGEWEETLVYVDLEDVPDAQNVISASTKSDASEETDDAGKSQSDVEIKIFNVDSDLPILLLGGKYLAGNWEDTLGTSLFFRKKSTNDGSSDIESGGEDGRNPPVEARRLRKDVDQKKLKNILPEPSIPYDPVFGGNYESETGGYELVAKSMKVLKAKYFPVVNEEVKGEDVVRDADNEFDQKDFQIPPVSQIRQFYDKDINYEAYAEKDIERRRMMQEKWAPMGSDKNKFQPVQVKSEPMELTREASNEDEILEFDSD